MCCAFTSLVLLGPRFFLFLWWLGRPLRFNVTFDNFILPFLGVLFLPWLTLMYVIVAPGGVIGIDWFWLVLALLADLGSYAGGGYGNRDRMPGYSR